MAAVVLDVAQGGMLEGGMTSTEPENSEGKVFIGGLSWETTSDSLRYYFEKFGELSDVALMADKRTGQPRGFGFVSYKDAAGNACLHACMLAHFT
jgi:RNA recognition motif-containing protein